MKMKWKMWLILSMTVSACITEYTTELGPPMYITGTHPRAAMPGDTIFVVGRNFAPNPQDNIALFTMDQKAVILDGSTDSLKVIVPESAETGHIVVYNKVQGTLSPKEFEVLSDFPREGLAALYTFTDDLKDKSGRGHHLFAAEPASQPTFTKDRYGNATSALLFDGQDDQLFAMDININHPLTIGCWLQYPQQLQGGILGTNNGGNNGLGIVLDMEGDLAVYIDNKVTYQYTSMLPAASAQWVFLAVTFDGQLMKIYINGEQKGASPNIGSVSATGIFTVGAIQQGGGPYKGAIDDITLYDRALSAYEVLQLFRQTTTKVKQANEN